MYYSTRRAINPLVENISQNNQSFLIAVAVISIALAVYVCFYPRDSHGSDGRKHWAVWDCT